MSRRVSCEHQGRRDDLRVPRCVQDPGAAAPFVPVPYPNLAPPMMAAGTCAQKVKILNMKAMKASTEISRSNGDEAGTLKGMISMTNMDKAKPVMGSPVVIIEGSGAMTWLKPTRHNGSNANSPPGAQIAPSQPVVIIGI
ncbi:MAG: DUF4150 domain-containing protein [Polyangiales bacterium]